MSQLNCQLARHQPIFILSVEKVLREDCSKRQQNLVRIITCRNVQTRILLLVPMKHVAVEFEKHLQSDLSIVFDCQEKGRVSLFVNLFYQIFKIAKFAQHNWELAMTIGHGMVQSISSTIVSDGQRTSRSKIQLQKANVPHNCSLNQISFTIWLYFLSLTRLLISVVLFTSLVVFSMPIFGEKSSLLTGDRIENDGKIPLISVRARQIKVNKTFFGSPYFPILQGWTFWSQIISCRPLLSQYDLLL